MNIVPSNEGGIRVDFWESLPGLPSGLFPLLVPCTERVPLLNALGQGGVVEVAVVPVNGSFAVVRSVSLLGGVDEFSHRFTGLILRTVGKVQLLLLVHGEKPLHHFGETVNDAVQEGFFSSSDAAGDGDEVRNDGFLVSHISL